MNQYEGPPIPVPSPEPLENKEKAPNPWEAVELLVGITSQEHAMCKAVRREDKGELIAWYEAANAEAEQDPTGEKKIILDIKLATMQYTIAKDFEQATEAFDALLEAKDRAIGEGRPNLAEKATRVMDMLDAVDPQ